MIKIKFHHAAVLAAAALALVGSGCSAPAQADPTTVSFDVRGWMTVPGSGEPCTTTSGYTDIHIGAQVMIMDEDGSTIGLGSLDTVNAQYPNCKFWFRVGNVPEGKAFYKINIGNAERGEITYSRSQLNDPISLSLG